MRLNYKKHRSRNISNVLLKIILVRYNLQKTAQSL